MKSIFLTAAVLLGMTANAHIEPGTWVGATIKSEECSMLVGEAFFENNMGHPLNERIRITVGADALVVGHPPVVSSADSLAYFNHDMFQGIVPTSTGAKAYIINMVHSATFEGPSSFEVIENQWKAGTKTHLKCENIKLIN